MSTTATNKRPLDDSPRNRKRLKLTGPGGTAIAVDVVASDASDEQPAAPEKPRIRKLAAPRPFPTVPTSVSATGPRSAHIEGKNLICITRKTSLATYLRRCKNVIIKDGYKTLHLSAMGAAIPLLLQLSVALPPILPFSPQEIHTETTTGTVEVQDEVLPEEDDADITQQTRGKSTLKVVMRIGDGEPSPLSSRTSKTKRHVKARVSIGESGRRQNGETTATVSNTEVVIQEPEQVEMEMV